MHCCTVHCAAVAVCIDALMHYSCYTVHCAAVAVCIDELMHCCCCTVHCCTVHCAAVAVCIDVLMHCSCCSLHCCTVHCAVCINALCSYCTAAFHNIALHSATPLHDNALMPNCTSVALHHHNAIIMIQRPVPLLHRSMCTTKDWCTLLL